MSAAEAREGAGGGDPGSAERHCARSAIERRLPRGRGEARLLGRDAAPRETLGEGVEAWWMSPAGAHGSDSFMTWAAS